MAGNKRGPKQRNVICMKCGKPAMYRQRVDAWVGTQWESHYWEFHHRSNARLSLPGLGSGVVEDVCTAPLNHSRGLAP